MGEKISITEFAKRANVSRQAVYKRLSQVDDKLTEYVNLVDNKKMLDIQALEDVYGIEVDKEVDKNDKLESTNCRGNVNCDNSQNQVKDMLLKQIEILQEELEIKNEQLKVKDQQIEQLHKILDQEQQLRMVSEQKKLEIEDSNSEQKEVKKKWWQFW